MTPRELAAAIAAFGVRPPARPTRRDLEALMRRFPDAGSRETLSAFS